MTVKSQFEWAFSDDLTYLRQAMDALLLHPGVEIIPQMAIASLVRQVCVSASNLLDVLLEECATDPHVGQFAIAVRTFLRSGKDEDLAEPARILRAAGAELDTQAIWDARAVRELRNALVHANWGRNEERRHWLSTTFFRTEGPNAPLDLQYFSLKHWSRIIAVTATVQRHIVESRIGALPPIADVMAPAHFVEMLRHVDVRATVLMFIRSEHDRARLQQSYSGRIPAWDLNYQPTLDPEMVNRLHIRNVLRFSWNMERSAGGRDQDSASPWTYVSKEEYDSLLTKMQETGIPDKGELEHYTYRTVETLGAMRHAGRLEEGRAVYEEDYENALRSWREVVARYADAELPESTQVLDAAKPLLARHLLGYALGSSEVGLEALPPQLRNEEALVAIQGAYEAFDGGIAAWFVYVQAPVFSRIVGGEVPYWPHWLAPALRLSALLRLVDNDRIDDLKFLAWAEATADALALVERSKWATNEDPPAHHEDEG